MHGYPNQLLCRHSPYPIFPGTHTPFSITHRYTDIHTNHKSHTYLTRHILFYTHYIHTAYTAVIFPDPPTGVPHTYTLYHTPCSYSTNTPHHTCIIPHTYISKHATHTTPHTYQYIPYVLKKTHTHIHTIP